MNRRLPLTLLLFLSGFLVLAQTPPPANLSGEALRTWLRDNWYTGKQHSLGYSAARVQMYSFVDVAEDNRVYGVYSGYSEPKSGSTSIGSINCEHTIPQSFFNYNEPLKSDIFHLYPTHSIPNNTRNNYPFTDIADAQTKTWYGVSANNTLISSSSIPTLSKDDYSEAGTSYFEPKEDHKGNVARSIFYFFTMYDMSGYGKSIESLVLNGDIELLYQWHLQDPVDEWERQRNNRIEQVQGNRNPYIDYPGLVCMAWGFDCGLSNIPTLTVDDTGFHNTFGLVAVNEWRSSSSFALNGENLLTTVTLTAPTGFQVSSDNVNYYPAIELIPQNNAISKEIYVKYDAKYADAAGVITISNADLSDITVEVGSTSVLSLFASDFNDCGAVSFSPYSISGDQNWICYAPGRSGNCYKMNGYSGGPVDNLDWLVSNEIDLSDARDPLLGFYSDQKFNGPVLEVYITPSYSGEPQSSNWTKLNAAFDTDNANYNSWTYSGDISLASYAGQKVRLAFKYQSGTVENAAYWAIDDVIISGKTSTSIWTGASSKEWNNTSNWFYNELPQGGSDLMILSSGNHPDFMSELQIKDLIIDKNAVLTLKSGASLAISGAVNNQGKVYVERNITESKGYSIVSSPVSEQSFAELSASLIYGFDGTQFTANLAASEDTFGEAKGYFVSQLNDDPKLVFAGTPNAGTQLAEVHAGNFELVGNPFTAPVSIKDLLYENRFVIAGTVYFWDDGGVNVGGQRGGDYITVNSLGAVGVRQPDNTDDAVDGLLGITGAENGFISTAQGVFVEAISSGFVQFTPAMLSTETGLNSDENYYRTTDFQKLRLVVSNEQLVAETLIGFGEAAMLQRDIIYDAKCIDKHPALSISTKIDSESYIIQGLPVPEYAEVKTDVEIQTAFSGYYQLKVKEMSGFPISANLSIRDLKTNESWTVSPEQTISLNLAAGDIRILELSYAVGNVLSVEVDNSLEVREIEEQLVVFGLTNGSQHISIFQLDGKLVYQQEADVHSNSAMLEFRPVQSMIYVMRVNNQSVKFLVK